MKTSNILFLLLFDFYFWSYMKNLNVNIYSSRRIYLMYISLYLKISFSLFHPEYRQTARYQLLYLKKSQWLCRQLQYTSIQSSNTETNSKVQSMTGVMLQGDDQTLCWNFAPHSKTSHCISIIQLTWKLQSICLWATAISS